MHDPPPTDGYADTSAIMTKAPSDISPSHDCNICPRLHGYIAQSRERNPDWFNGPVPTFMPEKGATSVKLLIIGLAPGIRGANRTGRPFTGDYAGDLLYATLRKFGFAKGNFEAHINDSLALIDTAVTNAVRCVPPENKPVASEINNCRQFLMPTIASFTNLKAIVTLGKISHDSTLRTLGARVAAYPFGHRQTAKLDDLTIFPSYHCSRYNTNTGRLTVQMFEEVFDDVRRFIDQE